MHWKEGRKEKKNKKWGHAYCATGSIKKKRKSVCMCQPACICIYIIIIIRQKKKNFAFWCVPEEWFGGKTLLFGVYPRDG